MDSCQTQAADVLRCGRAEEPAQIFVADDSPAMRQILTEILELEGYVVTQYNPAAADTLLLRRHYDVALLDIVMPNRDGFSLQQELAEESPETQFIFVTAHADREQMDRAMDLDVFALIPKPFTADHIRSAVRGALRVRQLTRKQAKGDVLIETEGIGLIGRSQRMMTVRQRILELAPLEVPVFLTGESGTGKEVIARCIHHCSRRKSKPFVAVNCAGLSPSLVESELFGHAQGAFTGAAKTKLGFFEVSDGGTIFLDEIGDLPTDLQSRLLRILDKGEYHRVGDPSGRIVDVRVISATNRNLAAMVAQGSFRGDLYYRLRGGQIVLPPLRERRDDIPALMRHFLNDHDIAIAPAAMDALMAFDWPGNIRELRMVAATLKGVAVNRVITGQTVARLLGVADSHGTGEPEVPTYRQFKERVLRDAERRYFESVLRRAGGNMSQAAEICGMHRKNLYEKLKKLAIDHAS